MNEDIHQGARQDGNQPGEAMSEIINTHVSSEVQQDTVDTIGVTLDYVPPVSTTEIPDEQVSTPSEERRSMSRRDRNRQSRTEYSFTRFYTKHWFGQCVSGVFTGIIFMTIGIVFMVFFKNLPVYIGILFILVSFPPCCMAANRYKYARARERQQQIRLMNRRALRRTQRESESIRTSQIPVADFPPSYSNLAFEGLADERDAGWTTSSVITDSALPTYQEFIEMKKNVDDDSNEDFNPRDSISSVGTDTDGPETD